MIDSELIRARQLKPPEGCDFWVFAYGSLMWRPGFQYIEARPALLKGYHRAFCIASTHYRGSPAQPGLVLGLERGGAIRQGVGIAGTNIDYLANTVCHLDELGIVDGPLHRLLRLVQGKD